MGANPTDFAIGSDGCTGRTVAAGATCNVTVSFAATVFGPRSAALSFSDDAAGSPHLTALNGTGRPIGGSFVPLTPARILDTRTTIGGHLGPLGQGQTLNLQVTGHGRVPASGVTAVVMNVTVTDTTAASYLTVYPADVTRPVASNLNWQSGATVPNLVEVALSADGQASFYNAVGSANVLADVAGWVASEDESTSAYGLFNPVQPARLLDTRTSNGGHLGQVRAGETVNLQVTGRGGVLQGVAAVVLNVTVTGPSASSYLTVWPAGRARPEASNLNYGPGQTVPNRVIVAVSYGGQISLYNAAGSTDVIVDVNGSFTTGTAATTGGRYLAHAPVRVYDSRAADGPLGAGRIRALATTYDATKVIAVVFNVTVTDTTSPSFLTVWPGQTNRPNASDLNWRPGLTVPNLVVVALGPDGSIDFFNAAGATDLIIDEVGLYTTLGASATGAQPSQWHSLEPLSSPLRGPS